MLDSIAKKPTIGMVGISSWDTILAIDEYPDPGGFAIVASTLELPGGTTSNSAAAAARLGARVDLISAVGDDPTGARLIEMIAGSGVDTSRVRMDPLEPTDQTTVISSASPPNRTIFWHAGAIPRMGDRIDVDHLFTRDLVLLDSVDPALRRFLTDLPVHTYPDVKILVPMTYAVDFPGRDELDSVVRCDALVGSETELCQLTGTDSWPAAIPALQERMRVSNLRCAAITLGADGAMAFDANSVFSVSALPVDVVDTTGAGDAFAGAFAFALACRMDLPEALELANCVAGLSTRALGAQTGLPTIEEAVAALRDASNQVPW